MRLEEALPDDAVYVRDLGNGEVWQTERWSYWIEKGTRRVINVIMRDQEERERAAWRRDW